MASYWNSIGTMLKGDALEVEPRRRSRFELDQGDLQGLGLEATEEGVDDEPASELNASAKSPSRLNLRESEVAEMPVERSRERSNVPARDQANTNNGAKPDLGARDRTRTERPVARPTSTDETVAPSKLETQVPQQKRIEESETAIVTSARPRDPFNADEQSPAPPPTADALTDRPRIERELDDDSHERLGQTDHDAETQASLSEIREDIADIVRAEPLEEPDQSPPDNLRADETNTTRPLVVEINHISIEIARPGQPNPQGQRPHREPPKPVISLDEFLDRTGGGVG